MKKVIEKKIQSDNDCAYGYLWAAYNLAKRELPKEEFPFMLDLIEMAGKDLKRDSTVHYSSNQSISEFQSAIADVILEDKLSELKKCGVYSIVLDESTDNANRKRLLVYAQYLSKSEIDTCLLNNIEITEGSATADVIVSKILMELRDKGLNLDNLVGVGTDGASVMTGRRNGVVKQLRDKCPSLVGVHCAAHRCALAASQATKNIQEMEWYSRTVSNVFRFFSNSALRENKLREIQELLELPQLKYADIHSVRWLSLENAVSILYRTYPALCATLSHIGASGDVVAKSLYNDVCQYKFIALTHLLMDILPFVGRLSKLFQSESLDFSKVSPMVASTCDSLQDLLECEGVFVDKLFTFTVEESGSVLYRRPSEESVSKTVNEGIKSNIEFDGFETDSDDASTESETVGDVTLRYYQQQKESLPSITRKYVNAITQNLENRFEQKELMQCLEVLVPTNITKQTSIGSYGEKELRIVAENFSTQTAINVDDCMSEYRQYKRLVVGSYSNKSLIEMYAILENKFLRNYQICFFCLSAVLFYLCPLLSVNVDFPRRTESKQSLGHA
ncbi:zinc finger protein 862-like [Mercenaria mercenaria]|uniref:zinc finger protein 862-like n=1 Tax=Mercenaria mercenaria TaxID=6596 RepID=UPI00234EF343|nr:zinc finger protein 862-like [Mercenaria mercenaria]